MHKVTKPKQPLVTSENNGEAIISESLYLLAQSGSFIPNHANPVDLAISELQSDHSKRVYESRLRSVSVLANIVDPRDFPWHKLRFEHLVAIKSYLYRDRKVSAGSINSTISAIRSVANASFNVGLMGADDLKRLINVKALTVSRGLAGRDVSLGQLNSLVEVCQNDRTPAGPRDALIIGLLYICGLRRSEASQLRLGAIDSQTQSLKIIGKGNKERITYPDSGTMAAYRDWMEVRGYAGTSLLLPVTKSGVIKKSVDGDQMSDQSIYNIVKKRSKQAGVPDCSPHDFRRKFATELLRNNKDVFTVQKLMGHSDPKTTSRYDQRSNEEAEEATKALHLPYTSTCIT